MKSIYKPLLIVISLIIAPSVYPQIWYEIRHGQWQVGYVKVSSDHLSFTQDFCLGTTLKGKFDILTARADGWVQPLFLRLLIIAVPPDLSSESRVVPPDLSSESRAVPPFIIHFTSQRSTNGDSSIKHNTYRRGGNLLTESVLKELIPESHVDKTSKMLLELFHIDACFSSFSVGDCHEVHDQCLLGGKALLHIDEKHEKPQQQLMWSGHYIGRKSTEIKGKCLFVDNRLVTISFKIPPAREIHLTELGGQPEIVEPFLLLPEQKTGDSCKHIPVESDDALATGCSGVSSDSGLGAFESKPSFKKNQKKPRK